MKALERAPPKSYLDAMQAMRKWVEGVEHILDTEPYAVTHLSAMHDSLTQFKVDISRCFTNLQSASHAVIITHDIKYFEVLISCVIHDYHVWQELEVDLADHLSNLEYIQQTGQELVSKADSQERADRLQSDLQDLNNRWATISEGLHSRITKIHQGIQQIKHFQVLF